MVFNILTLFPELIKDLNDYSIIGRAIKEKKIKLNTYNLRDFGIGKYRQVDDKPYGGGPGMIMRVDVADKALQKIKKENPGTFLVLLDPRGKQFNQQITANLAKKKNLTLICGHYEGVDERICGLVNDIISVGPYVVSGGEIPAMLVIDATSRLIPGVLGNMKSLKEESFQIKDRDPHKTSLARHPELACTERSRSVSGSIQKMLNQVQHDDVYKSCKDYLEYAQYTRPEIYKGKKVPEVLLSGNHQKIKKWREQQKLSMGQKPDL